MARIDDEIRGWFSGQIPDGWFESPPEVTGDREEIMVVGTLTSPKQADEAAGDEREIAESARIDRFREDTREMRMRIAREAEHRFGRKVSWGAACGGTRKHFTTLGVPVMTRLRLPEREVLDTLMDAGVARSRSEALAWCVRLVGQHESDWLGELRDAMSKVEEVRSRGPK